MLDWISIPVTGVTLDVEEMELVVGEKGTITANVSPSNAANKEVSWVSSNPYVASVQDGVVYALKEGNATIIATADDGGKSASCRVYVKAKTQGGTNDGDAGGEVGEPETFGPATVSVMDVTATTATLKVHVDFPQSDLSASQVVLYYSDEAELDLDNAQIVFNSDFDINNDAILRLTGLKQNTVYCYSVLLIAHGEEVLSKVSNFKTDSVSVNLTMDGLSFTPSSPIASFTGRINGFSDEDKNQVEIGVAYYTDKGYLHSGYSNKVPVSEILPGNIFSISIDGLDADVNYYYCPYVMQNHEYTYGSIREFDTTHPYTQASGANLSLDAAVDLSLYGSANCYIISEPGLYKFKKAKGNSSMSVGSVATAVVVWETFGTDVAPNFLDLIKAVCYKDGYIVFQTADVYKEGNALIAAKDSAGNILWSWHIWMTDQPEEHAYYGLYNRETAVMDRFLGATSATPGEVGTLGLLYQWGRKDPFLASSSITENVEAKSTIVWPWAVQTTSYYGTVGYATENPTTFIISSGHWVFYSSSSDNLWASWNKIKSIYDPCPLGWRVPCGSNITGFWKSAFENYDYDKGARPVWDKEKCGVNYGGIVGPSDLIWYQFTGYRQGSKGFLYDVGKYGTFWTDCEDVIISADERVPGLVEPVSYQLYDSNRPYYEATGRSVRCIKEYSL